MKTLKFTKEKAYDNGYGWLINYTCGGWSIINVESEWMITYNKKVITTVRTLKDAKASVCGMVAFNEELI
tara:strand:- start:271 stop:480 length:210 start_codon:yes stop_codon:yes gene_type:complete